MKTVIALQRNKKKILLSAAIVAMGCTSLNAASIEELTKDALINTTTHTLAGTFGQHDFPGSENAFDWAFTTTGGDSYQLKGNAPSENDAFGWKLAAGIATPTPQWYMFAVDIDGDGHNSKFEWVLLSTDMNNKAVYKLAGASESGTFLYAGPIDIDYQMDGNTITTGAAGTLNTGADACIGGCHSISASKLAGYTVVSAQEGAITMNGIKQVLFIFQAGNQVIVVTDYLNDTRKVVRAAYEIANNFGINMVEIAGLDDEGEFYNSGIALNDNQEVVVGESLAGAYLASGIVANSGNGIDEATVASIGSSAPDNSALFTIKSTDDVKGYTFSSNNSTINPGGQYEMHQTVKVAFKCDGTFEYTIVTSASGVSSTSHTTGSTVEFDTTFQPHELKWSGTDDEGEVMNDSLELNENDQLVIGSTCWSGFGDGLGEACPNNLYVYSVSRDAVCN